MRLIKEKIGEYGELTGYLRDISPAMPNIERFPAILILPGGGFRMCSPREMEPIALAYLAQGYQAFTLKYTTVTDSPSAKIEAPMEDVHRALEIIKGKSGEYNIAEGKVAMIGFSGGGHLAAAVATHGPVRPDALLLGYPGILHSKLRAMECPDIIERTDKNVPPTFIFSIWSDKVTPPPHALAFAQALYDAGVECELHIFRYGEHGLSLATPLTSMGERSQVVPSVAKWFQMSVEWLREKFGDFTVYGVNDGRYGRFSIDSKLSEILADHDALKVARENIPGFDTIKNDPRGQNISLRAIANYTGSISKDTLEKVDSILLKL